ncbi:MAG: argininosuccinate lyase [Nitrososphaerales archaeon]
MTRKKDKEADLIHSSRLGKFSSSAATYTSSIDIDPRILKATIDVNLAHVLMLAKQKAIPSDAAKSVIFALKHIPPSLELDEHLEDVHMNIEDKVISLAGKEAGGMLNLGKSRNDQVATALRMQTRSELISISRELIRLLEVLVAKAFRSTNAVMPGYTHLQRGQPVTVAHHLIAHEQALQRDLERLFACYERVNFSPMGSGALASSSVPLDQKLVAFLLGFEGVMINSLDGVSSRDFAIESIFVACQIMVDLSRLAEEVIIWSSKEFSFVSISDEFSATSSMMPQKKNPIVPEIARARASQTIGHLVGALGIVKSLPLSYNLDLQELTRDLWGALDKTRDTISLFSEMIEGMIFNEDALRRATSSDETLFATELADYLVLKYKVPFREAHSKVASLVKYAETSKNLSRAFTERTGEELESILGFALSKSELAKILDPKEFLLRRKTSSSPNPRLVKSSCKKEAKIIAKQAKKLNLIEQKLAISSENLYSEAERFFGNFTMIKEKEKGRIEKSGFEGKTSTEVKQQG